MPSVELPLTKFPSGWGSVEFWANPPDIDFGQSTTLHWSGPPGATYAIEYAAGGDVVNLPPAGQPPFASNGVWPGANDPPLAPAETTVFTLTVEETIGSEQYATRVQETVTVVRPGPRIERFAGTLAVAAGGGYAVTFEWATQSADHCQLSGVEYLLPTASPPGGYSVPASPPWNAGYVLEAIGNGATASSTLSAAWQTRSTTDIPADMASDLALSPDGSLLYVAVAQDLLIYSVPASAEGPLPEPGSFPQPPYGVEPARLAGAEPGPAQSVWASFAYEESLIALLAVEEGGLFERGGTAVSVSPTLPAIAATKGGARVYAAVAGTVSAYDSDLASNVTLAWTASCATGAGLAASADGSLYVASDVLAAYTVDDAGTDHLVPAGSLSLGGATATGVAVAGGVVFVALGTSVLVADRAGMQPLAAPIPVAADRIAVSPDGLRLYALDIAAGTVAVLSPTPLTGGVAG
jgi:DNA-binding beta-propeller fold protein YncE